MYAIIDIETTGGSARTGKITEIAIITHDGTRVTDRYSTLINPEVPIPEYIQRFTGITDHMVARAPRFFEVAADIVKITEGKIFVAHNANFDYGFIKEEFARLGYTYRREHLCTVKLSRKIFPGFRSYSLGNLCESLGIGISDRHRALGDAEATALLFDKLVRSEEFSADSKEKGKPGKHLLTREPEGAKKLPEACGIYYFENDAGEVLYVGKAKDIRQRVKSHFANVNTRKARQMATEVTQVHAEVLHNESVALIRESLEIARLKPRFNIAGKKPSNRSYLVTGVSPKGYITFDISRLPGEEETVLAGYSSAQKASQQLEEYGKLFALCDAYCGKSEPGKKCFRRSINQCLGACTAEESADTYNARATRVVSKFLFNDDDFVWVFPSAEGMVWLLRAGNHRKISLKQVDAGMLQGVSDWAELLPLSDPGNSTLYIIKGIESSGKYLKKIVLGQKDLFSYSE